MKYDSYISEREQVQLLHYHWPSLAKHQTSTTQTFRQLATIYTRGQTRMSSNNSNKHYVTTCHVHERARSEKTTKHLMNE